MVWCFDDESHPLADATWTFLTVDTAIVPAVWWLEVGNAVLSSQRRQRISKAASSRFLQRLRLLPIETDQFGSDSVIEEVVDLAEVHSLTSYDAAYLELAIRQDLPLATLDSSLSRAATGAGVAIFTAGES